MSDKAKTKNQKTQAQEAKKEKTTIVVDDFFTQFLDKRQKNFNKKLEKIEELKKKNPAELTTEQKDMVTNVHLTLEKIKYFDDIKELYSQAFLKKEQNEKALDNQISDLLDLFFTGCIMQHLPSSSLESIEKTLPKEHQKKVGELHHHAFKPSHTHDSLKEAKNVVKSALDDLTFVESLRNTVNSQILSNHNLINNVVEVVEIAQVEAPVQCEVHLVKKEKKSVQPKKQAIFVDDDEDEEIEVETRVSQKSVGKASPVKSQKVTENQPKNNQEETEVIKIAQLPVEDEEKNERVHKKGYRSYNGGKDGNPNYRKNNYKNRNFHQNDNHNQALNHNEDQRGERVERGERRNYNRANNPNTYEPRNDEERRERRSYQPRDGEYQRKPYNNRRTYNDNRTAKPEEEDKPKINQA